MKQITPLFLILFFCSCAFSQDVKFKKEIISIDGKPCLKHDRTGNTISFYDLSGEVIISLNYANSYARIVFVKQKIKVTSSGTLYTKWDFMKHLVKNGACSDCAFNNERIETFAIQFDDRLEK